MKKNSLSWFLLSLLFVSIGCGGGEESTEAPDRETSSAAEAAVYQPTGNEGTIRGKINFSGQVPKLRPISMQADAACAAKHSAPVYPEVVVANDGMLANVFVYIKSGLEGKKFAVPADSVLLDQDGCLYKPHVLGIQARQQLKITSQDDTTHNVHPLPKINREWNESQPPGVVLTKSFPRGEIMIPVKCNQHPWMRAYIGVLDNPFYAVSGRDGSFEIKGVPPGEYEIEAWHEKYGAQTMKLTVEAKGTASVEFTMGEGQAFHSGSLEMMPALVLH